MKNSLKNTVVEENLNENHRDDMKWGCNMTVTENYAQKCWFVQAKGIGNRRCALKPIYNVWNTPGIKIKISFYQNTKRIIGNNSDRPGILLISLYTIAKIFLKPAYHFWFDQKWVKFVYHTLSLHSPESKLERNNFVLM